MSSRVSQVRDEALALTRTGFSLDRARKEVLRLQRQCDRLCDARRDLGSGASRARVTTANARWISAAEARDRMLIVVELLEGDDKGGP